MIFYYESPEELLKEEEKFNEMRVGLNLIGKNYPIRICPRGDTNVVLLYNTGDETQDLKRLNENLKRLNLLEVRELK